MKIVVRSFSRLFFSPPRSRIYTAACTIDSLRRATLEQTRSALTDGTNYYRYYTPQITRTFLTESSSFLFLRQWWLRAMTPVRNRRKTGAARETKREVSSTLRLGHFTSIVRKVSDAPSLLFYLSVWKREVEVSN